MNKPDNNTAQDMMYGISAGKVNVAYDLSVFDARSRGSAVGNVTSIVNKRRRQQARSTMLKNILLCVFVVGMLAGIIVSSTQLTELTSEASALKSRHEELLSEEKRLQAQLDMQTNLKEVELLATEKLYMQKLEPTQIVYIDLASEDFGMVIDDERGVAGRAADLLRGCVLKLSEYVD